MTTQNFYVSTRHHQMWEGPVRYIRIMLYDTAVELRKAAAKSNVSYWVNGSNEDNTLGLFTPARTRLYYAKDGTETNLTDPHYAGLMRLCMDYLSYEIIAHECVHAACAIYRLDITKSIVLHTECNLREEQFAYLVGQLTNDVVWELRHFI